MRTTCQRIGMPPISTSGFGIAWVRSWSLVPRPPQRIATGVSAAADCSSATGDGRQDGHLVAVGELRVEAVLEADVLARDVDIDESAQGPVLGDPLTKVSVGVEYRVERFTDGVAVDLDLFLASGRHPELGRN